MATVIMPIPDRDFDPTETGVPWRTLRLRGHRVEFATPNGKVARADPRMITGEGLGIFAALMKADNNGRSAYEEMSECEEFRHPIAYADIRPEKVDGILLPGGHAQGMREYLESNRLQSVVAQFFARNQPAGAICHGVLLAARSRRSDGRSVLYGKKTTALTKFMELTAWALTWLYLGGYYRTYPTTVEDEASSTRSSRTFCPRSDQHGSRLARQFGRRLYGARRKLSVRALAWRCTPIRQRLLGNAGVLIVRAR